MRTWLLLSRFIILVIVGFAVAACGSSAQPTSSPAPLSNPFGIGAPLAITRLYSVEANLTKGGYDLWADEVNKAGGLRIGRQRRMVEIKYYDDESDAQKSGQFAEQLILDDGIRLLLRPYGTAATNKVAEIAERYHVPLVEGNGAVESIFNQGYKYTFGVLSPAKQYGVAMADPAAHQDSMPASTAILFANDAFAIEVAESAKAFAESLGIDVSVYERYQIDITGLSGLVTLAKISGAEMLLKRWPIGA